MKNHLMTMVAAPVLVTLIASAGNAQTRTADADQDGIADDRDAGLWTPKGATVIAQGCSALDIAQFPEALTDPLLRELDDVSARMQQRIDLTAVLRETGAIRSSIEAAADAIRPSSDTRFVPVTPPRETPRKRD